ncbi:MULTISPECIES: MauE/DoxX family redox-associated membrane protein [Chryseobacterium]|uniref:Thiosulfate dehydrogenase [quinone] large subunit n=1 Tax=Chryseobacterium camelliae TaxID=1265445 RepID=A0ABU0TGS0_9FLAO|nr:MULTISPECIES: MauE/DoxX family redox-associated membrane protein [Chryseobacterium]MDT3405946.1 thiosulfate dehydrogenase [quinone] large subunit [Pseudacidovorax intermedius]MDQ1096250.1 thiosulfate dehydrogenase [quinone] large subunit [Chryseobacterium camelliae]MDQ1100187.1 thiosulfate dehydrogenase [quinone] large subunit [Chryseobacterium sp. SORGH_AS_1048]MDR6087531.1 thiosulfate dehydrogenase [quinone] large subunit [Chryseobacterium sp. SORGH_AS_0909]MDR6131906.1 thiosulfate dehydr
MKDFKTAFFFLRLPIAVSLAGHGLVRLPKLQAFSDWMVKTMEKSALPEVVIVPFSYFLPVAEAAIGILLLTGYKSKLAIYSGLVLMSMLIMGSCSIENWTAIEAQLLHSAYLAGLFWFFIRYSGETTDKIST